MKILFLSDVPLENPISGAEQVLYQQAVGLVREGMEVFAITRQEGSSSLAFKNVEGVEEACYSALAKNMIQFFFSLLKKPPYLYNRFIQEGPFDVCISLSPFTCLALLKRRKLRNIPMLYHFNSPSHEEYMLSHEDKSWLKNLPHISIRRRAERFCLKRAARIMVLSRYMKEKIQNIHGIPADRITINPGGVDLARFKPVKDRKLLKKQLSFPEGMIHLLTVRNLDSRMGIDNLLKGIHILKERRTRVHLILGGEGPERKKLENLIVEYGLNNEVTMAGFIPSELLPQYYAASDFFILPTRQLEGFGLVTVESMACGTPALGTPVGGTVDILSGLDEQFLFKDTSPDAMAEGIQMALDKHFSQEQKYDELRIYCRKYVERKYSWQGHVNQLKEILTWIIHESRLLQRRGSGP